MSSNSLFQIEIAEEKGLVEIIPSEEFASMTRYEQILAVEEELSSYEAELQNITNPVGGEITGDEKSCRHEKEDQGRIEFRIRILQNFLQRLIDMTQDGNTE
ncbi:MAG: hypothetical protein A4E70_00200 [Syntrophus sp. PtaU1.Bin005]|uniref:hypothetical protein n=1 Tax=Syntrophus TaxID=43773 RepID=UPI0009C70846|nr:MAG: hypothetical protein A4E69_03045 [Syntrophus sp. PtaB.Bin138]OPY83690.1 MAG: hypothetical protein A4E70_00200 [Syntrophus sp. PtaU1.Bin005]